MTRRLFTALLLALMLALTGQSMAVARGAAAATGQMVLCTGSGPVAIYFDAEGKPTSAPHICPDASLTTTIEGALVLPDAPARLVTFDAPQINAFVAELAPRKDRPAPRAPPVSV
jgi:hypothetical protein